MSDKISDDLKETLLLTFDMLPLSVEISDETLFLVTYISLDSV